MRDRWTFLFRKILYTGDNAFTIRIAPPYYFLFTSYSFRPQNCEGSSIGR